MISDPVIRVGVTHRRDIATQGYGAEDPASPAGPLGPRLAPVAVLSYPQSSTVQEQVVSG